MKILDTLSSIFRITIFSGSLFQVGWTVWPLLIYKERYLPTTKKELFSSFIFYWKFYSTLVYNHIIKFRISTSQVLFSSRYPSFRENYPISVDRARRQQIGSPTDVELIWWEIETCLQLSSPDWYHIYKIKRPQPTSLQRYLTKFSFFHVNFIIDKNVGRDCHKFRRIKSYS